jgi:hypothetical protein
MSFIPRTRLLDKVRALLAKTMDAGCTEEETLSALAKARAMIDAYEITDEELALTKEEKAIIHPTGEHKDKYDIKWNFISAVAKFCDCDVWHDSKNGFTFCGQRSDIDFAIWLADHLADFVRGELTNYLAKTIIPPYQRPAAHVGGRGMTGTLLLWLNALFIACAGMTAVLWVLHALSN